MFPRDLSLGSPVRFFCPYHLCSATVDSRFTGYEGPLGHPDIPRRSHKNILSNNSEVFRQNLLVKPHSDVEIHILAYPFQLSPEEALVQLAPYASALCLFKDLLGSLGARLLPGFGFKPVQPLRITPVYFPAWIVDAEVQVDVSYKDVQVSHFK